MKLGVITGSTRKGNVGASVGDWVVENLSQRTDVDVVDIRVGDYDLGFVEEEVIPGEANGKYENPNTTKWAEIIDGCDAFVFVTAEYNAAPPAAFKNAADLLFVEWKNKPVGFVGYGFHKGARAIKHWRDIVANLKMRAVEATVNINFAEELVDGEFRPADGQAEQLQMVVDEIVALESGA